MYCVVQEIKLKKPNSQGTYKNFESYSFSINGLEKYSHRHSGERFERPIKKTYKISIHESKRVNGVVTKKQYAVTTINYYNLLDWFELGDYDRIIDNNKYC